MARLSEAQRLWIVHLATEGSTTSAIANKLGCSGKTVRFWIHAYGERRSVKSIKATGRPSLLSTAARKRAVELFLKRESGGSRFVSRQLLSENYVGRLLAPGTVLRAAKAQAVEDGDPLVCRRGRPPKRLTRTTRTKRIRFAKANKQRAWGSVMFTDRCKFHFRYPGCTVQRCRWLRKSTIHEDGEFRPNRPSVYNVYGGITRYGTTRLREVTGTTGAPSVYRNLQGAVARNITSREYLDVVKKTLLPEGRRIFSAQGMACWVLQQDNDPAHARAVRVVEEYNKKGSGTVVSLLKAWPGNSPDLSPIENVWAYVDAEVAKLGCKTFQEFKAAIDVTFENIPRSMCANLFASMPKRMKKCVDLDGAKIGY